MGCAAMLLLIFLAQLLRRDPAIMGVLPDGGPRTGPAGSEPASYPVETGASFREALKGRQLWTIFFANLSVAFSLMSVMLHIVPHARDIGIAPKAAAGLLSTIGGVSMIGRFATGNAIDRIGNRLSMIFSFLLLVAVLLWLQMADALWMLYLFAAAYGFAHGGFFTAVSPIIAEYFGLCSHGLLFGVAVFAITIGGFIGPILTGYIFDLTGSYRLAFWACIGAAVMGLGLMVSLGPVRPRAVKPMTVRPGGLDSPESLGRPDR
jgi:MFS family permease